jgi:hypothetical protein
MATSGDKGKVTIMSSAKDNFGEVISTLEATGTFGTAVEYVRGPQIRCPFSVCRLTRLNE